MMLLRGPLFYAVVLLMCAWRASADTLPECPNCGNNPVPYPLSTAPSCGHPSYKVRCEAGKLMFDTVNSSYAIKSIDPLRRRLVITPSDFEEGTCVKKDFPYHGVQLNSSLPFNITSDNTVLFLNCSDLILKSPLDCSSTSLCHSYISSPSSEAAACADAPICCSFRTGGSATAYMIRLRPNGCKAYQSFVNLNPNEPEWSNTGLEFQWMPLKELRTDATK